jgi:uncharacterized protein YjbJ (UPF0337 family)
MIDERTNSNENETEAGFADNARRRAIEAYENARDGVSGAGRRAVDTIGEAPLIALAGGLAAGALIAALLPRTDTEAKLVRPTARRVKNTARAAYNAAKETGSERFSELGLTRDKGEETIRSLLQGVTDAAKASAQEAVDAARNKD